MTILYLPAFLRDLKRLKGTRDYGLTFARVLHRREIYRFFP